MAEGRGRDKRAEPQGGGHGGEPGQRRPGIEGATLLLPHDGAVMVRAKQRLVAVLLARADERKPVVPGHALLTLDHHAESHGGHFAWTSWVGIGDEVATGSQPRCDRSARRTLGRSRLSDGSRRRRRRWARTRWRDPGAGPSVARRQWGGVRRRHRAGRRRLGSGAARGDPALRGSRARPEGLQRLRIHRRAEAVGAHVPAGGGSPTNTHGSSSTATACARPAARRARRLVLSTVLATKSCTSISASTGSAKPA